VLEKPVDSEGPGRSCPFRKLRPWLAVSGESEHDRCIIAIGLLFVRMLCDLRKRMC
jgi:hypothetical protein